MTTFFIIAGGIGAFAVLAGLVLRLCEAGEKICERLERIENALNRPRR
jgi:hypothetical protein